MKICTTCSKWSHKSDFGLGSTLRNFLSTKTEFSVSWARLWPDFTLCPLQIRLWSLNEFCSWYLGLQLVSWLFSMLTNGLGVMDRWKHAVRPVVCSAVWTESLLQCRPFQCFTAACMPRVAGRLTAQATRCGRPGTVGLALIPRAPARPTHPLIFHFLRLLPSSPQQPQPCRAAPP